MSDAPQSSLANTLQALSRALSVLGPEASLQFGVPPDPRLIELIATLPKLSEADLDLDGVCPICLVQFRAHLAEEELALAMGSPAQASEDLGVTRLENTCRHIFCRKDISTWIRQARNSCPTCRRPLLDPSLGQIEETMAQTPSLEDQHAAAQMADEVIREVLEALGPADGTDGQPNPDRGESVRRLLGTLLPGIPQFEVEHLGDDGHQYPDRSEFGMYS